MQLYHEKKKSILINNIDNCICFVMMHFLFFYYLKDETDIY
jgi:hypothetical protein